MKLTATETNKLVAKGKEIVAQPRFGELAEKHAEALGCSVEDCLNYYAAKAMRKTYPELYQ